MKHKKFLLIALICLIGIGISFLLFSAHRYLLFQESQEAACKDENIISKT